MMDKKAETYAEYLSKNKLYVVFPPRPEPHHDWKTDVLTIAQTEEINRRKKKDSHA